jgi:hypothetical protein
MCIAFFSDPEMPHILGRPTELLIKTFTDLDVWDLGSCLLSCRRLKVIIQDTCLLQYLIQTALAGVHDPLCQSGPPITHRLESLKRWSDAWHQPGAYLRSPSRVLTPTSNWSSKDFILCDDYLIALDFSGRQWYRRASGYERLDLRNPNDGWAKIQFEDNLIPLAESQLHWTQIRICWIYFLGKPDPQTQTHARVEFPHCLWL